MSHGLLYYILKRLKKRLEILHIDFTQPWWKVITQQRLHLVVSLICETIYSVFRPLAILSLGFVLSSPNSYFFILLFSLWAFVYMISLIGRLSNCTLQLRAVHSVHYQAHKHFLQVDPVYHAKRSSGTILGKIDRASRAYEDLLDAVFLDLLQTVAGILTVILSFMYQSWKLAMMTTIFLTVIAFLNYVVSKFYIIPNEKRVVRADDKVRAVSVENLSQIQLIRTCFASDMAVNRLKAKDVKLMRKEGELWFLYCFFYFLIRLLYTLSIALIGWYVFVAIKEQAMSVALGVSVLVSYLRGSYEIVRVEKPMRNTIKSITRIRDLFSYANSFGQQTFPVLQNISPKDRMNIRTGNNQITIEACSLYFHYPENAKIFDGNSFVLRVDGASNNKLYGVIGPSGVGKSTLMSLLGGQIRPDTGKVFINAIDIYQVDDIARRQILALQGQVSTNVRGTLRYNILFGLPEKDVYEVDDDLLIALLQQVGLWWLFESKEGLDTFIGEAGLTLSGGQRQRLNFANLYLRATCYNPSIILIDEPTSSLDEISERAITGMISELATRAVTIVIAHRLHTVNNAVGLIDCSLISQEKEMTPYTHEELLQKSVYYKNLVEGYISIEE